VFERLDAPPALSPGERQLLDSVRALARDAIRRALDLPLPEGLKIEADLSTLAFQTADSVEGMTAVIEKRPPVFGDR
jgi:enoyl-CoA hydratase/carnithine racemase